MVCAFNNGTTRIGCSAHYVNKVIEHAFDLDKSVCPAIQNLFVIVRDIVSHIRQSHKQSSLSVSVQNYCKTRFSTVYIMLNTFIMVYNELPSALSNTQRQNYLKVNQNELEQVTRYLKHFHDVIEKLSCEQTPTLHLVLPYKQLLIDRSTRDDDDHLSLVQLKNYVSEHLKDYWVVHDVHYIAMLLHPNLKNFHLMPNKKKHALDLLQLELDKLLDSAVVHPLRTTISNKEKNKVKKNVHLPHSLDEIFDVPDDENYLQKPSIEKSEIDLYLTDEARVDNNMNLLMYWNSNKTVYPNLARIAKRILSIPATNTSVERLFSHSGNTITNRRTRLDDEKVNSLLFIKRNMRVLKEIYPPPTEHSNKRKSNLLSASSTSSTTPNKKIKLVTATNEVDEATTDEDNDDEHI
jgi:predicted small metal-binding protein